MNHPLFPRPLSRVLRGYRDISAVLGDFDAFWSDLVHEPKETDASYTYVLALPGFKKTDIDVEAIDLVEGTDLAIRAMRTNANDDRYPVAFRTISLPSDADSTKVEAKLEDGLLTMTVAKVAKPTPPAPRKVTVS